MAEPRMIMEEKERAFVCKDSNSDCTPRDSGSQWVEGEESVDGPLPDYGCKQVGLESTSENKTSGNTGLKQQAIAPDQPAGSSGCLGKVHELLYKCNNSPKRDQLYPMRNIADDKDCLLVGRLSHGQAEATAVENGGQSSQEKGKEPIKKSSIQNYKQYGTAMKGNETMPKDTEIECCGESDLKATHRHACSQFVNFKTDSAQLCPGSSHCLENDAPKQRPESLTALNAITLDKLPGNDKSPNSKEQFQKIPPKQCHHIKVPDCKEQIQKVPPKEFHHAETPASKKQFHHIEMPTSKEPLQEVLSKESETPVSKEQFHYNEMQASEEQCQKVPPRQCHHIEMPASKEPLQNVPPRQFHHIEMPGSGEQFQEVSGKEFHHTEMPASEEPLQNVPQRQCYHINLPASKEQLEEIPPKEFHHIEIQASGEQFQNILPEQFHQIEMQASKEPFQTVPPKRFHHIMTQTSEEDILSKPVHENDMPVSGQLREIIVSEEQHKMPIPADSVPIVKAEQLSEDQTAGMMQCIQNREQQEDKKTLENSNGITERHTVVPVVEFPPQSKSVETSTQTAHQQAKNSPPLETSDHHRAVVDAKATQTKDFETHETLPSDVLHEMEQCTAPVQPYYAEPPDFQEHLYVEADDIGLEARQEVERLDHVTLNIAITGMTGAGKSTFINAVRSIDNDDERAAPTGATETTMDACAYPHPTMPNVSLWDLPGTGSPKFKVKKYLKHVKFERYDFFIIISSERFKENDMMLAKEILKKKKKFYFLRSKIDNDIRAEQYKKNFNADALIACVREDLVQHLKNVVNPTVFLVSSFDLDKYDFPALVDTLIADLPEHKREALILSLPIYSTQMLERKIKSFESTALKAAKAASNISMAPIPGLAMACDAGILLAFFSKCYHALGLDDKSLDKLSERVNNKSLKALRETRPFVMAIRNNELSSRELSALGSKRAALEFAYSLVPVWGSKRAAGMSHSATLGLLNEGLKELADTAREVLKVAKIDHIKGS